ncbi:hypothetical protein HanRHA438_Chr14g0660411 [Helianthus annuus]|nr:hypothetical protein HanLR1_Chr14g0538901 [Helianthus annuus]KAJ0660301.1 hypothetical protein HanOQP8_Chr14g0536291 [Helianthus annuus]KAJ0854236.1 hypothetical protein HanRHA438_Chr14g0660411 [Helianthus annuus]
MPTLRKKVINAIFFMTIWKIWIHRNEKIFKCKAVSVDNITEEIKEESFWWMAKRSRMVGISMENRGDFDVGLQF